MHDLLGASASSSFPIVRHISQSSIAVFTLCHRRPPGPLRIVASNDGSGTSRLRVWMNMAGFEPHELIGTPSLDLVHPDEFSQTRAIHYSTITQDQAAVLVYLRLRHKDPCKGYVLCAIVSISPSGWI